MFSLFEKYKKYKDMNEDVNVNEIEATCSAELMEQSEYLAINQSVRFGMVLIGKSVSKTGEGASSNLAVLTNGFRLKLLGVW